MAVVISSGHQNIRENQNARLHGGTGAPDEVVFTTSLGLDLVQQLNDIGIEAVHTDANFHEGIYHQGPVALYMALHYDSYVDGKDRGCRFARPALDYAAEESDRMVKLLVDNYPKATGIPLYQNNAATTNMTGYYGFQYPDKEVPSVIVEAGVGHHPLDREILCNPDGTAKREIMLVLASLIQSFMRGSGVTMPVADSAEEMGPTDYVKMLKWQHATMRLIQIAKEIRAGDPSHVGVLDRIEQAYGRVVSGQDIYPEWRED
jgi:hypothetical protein